MPIKDWPTTERPREKLLRLGPSALSEAELIALFIGSGIRGKSALDCARDMLTKFGSLRALLVCDQAHLDQAPGLGPARYALLQAALELARRHFQELMQTGPALTSANGTRDYLRVRLRDLRHEVFCCLFLDSRHRVIECEELFRGTIDGATVHCREVVKRALAHNAAAVIFAHNHPSGIAEPSQADEFITKRLKDALGTVDIRVLDHLIVGDGACVSMAERGML